MSATSPVVVLVMAARTWRVRMSNGILIRVGGLPIKATEALGSPEIESALRRGRHLKRELAELCLTVTTMLFEQIHAMSGDRRLRLGLLKLKRDIHNCREAMFSRQNCAAGLTPALEERLDAWHSLQTTIQLHSRDAAALVEAHVERGHHYLQTISAQPNFRAGLFSASPAFGRSLETFQYWQGGKPDRKVRQTETTLLSFVYRTALKTSPFSRLTLVCFGTCENGNSLIPDIDGGCITTEVRPNLSLIARVRYLVMRHVKEFPTLELMLPTYRERSRTHINYRRRVETLIDEPGPVHATMREFAFSLRITRSLEKILDRLEAGVATVAQLRSILVEEVGMTEAAADDYISLLSKKDLLRVVALESSTIDNSCWARFGERIRATAEPHLVTVADAIAQLVVTCAEYGNAEAAERDKLISQTGKQLDAAIGLISRGAHAPRPLLYEDATLCTAPLTLGRDDWMPVVEHLPAVQRFLSLFDLLLPSRLSMRAIFVRTYGVGGSCDDVAGFSDFFHDRFFSTYLAKGGVRNDRFGTGRLNSQLVPDLDDIDRTKQQILNFVAARRLHNTPFEIELPDALVNCAGEAGAAEQPYLANAFYLQVATIDGRPSAVLNKVYGGGGSAFSRFDPLFGDSDCRPVASMLRETLAARDSVEKVFAEFQAGYDTNLNQHELLTATEIVFNGEAGVAPRSQQVALRELSIRHDSDRDRLYLYCARLGVEIVPVYAGMFYPLAMPELQKLLMHFSCPITLQGTFFPEFGKDDAETPGFYPRVRFRNVVLERARWVFDLADTILRAPGESDYALIARWDAWRRAHTVPTTCYVKVLAATVTSFGSQAQQKPFFVDFINPFCISLLDKTLKGRDGTVHFIEALPDTGDAIATVDGEKRVSEYVVEFFQEETLHG